MPRKLDRSRPAQMMWGDHDQNGWFIQDGLLFTAAGDLAPGQVEPPPAVVPRDQMEILREENERLKAQLAAQSIAGKTK